MGDGRLEAGVEAIVVALCADYERRRLAIAQKSVTRRTDTEYRYLNFKIYDACLEAVGEELTELFISEIGSRTGYAHSAAEMMSEVTYKNYKRRAKEAIAKRLHLIDGYEYSP